MKLDGKRPDACCTRYGGFQVSQTPGYSGTVGKLWLENGGVYVVANIRGGGEFGPRWHNAGLKLNRHAGLRRLLRRLRGSHPRGRSPVPRRLGIMGGSNGGLLMGVALTKRPELYQRHRSSRCRCST